MCCYDENGGEGTNLSDGYVVVCCLMARGRSERRRRVPTVYCRIIFFVVAVIPSISSRGKPLAPQDSVICSYALPNINVTKTTATLYLLAENLCKV